MTEDTRGPDAQGLARDWITLWQSELAAMAADQEMQENWARIAGFWTSQAPSFMPGTGTAAHDPARRPRPDAPPGAETPAAASPADINEQLERLTSRIAGLEERLARLERG